MQVVKNTAISVDFNNKESYNIKHLSTVSGFVVPFR